MKMPTFCEDIYSATRDLHAKAEGSAIMKKYINKSITLAEHVDVLYQQMLIFTALETALSKSPFSKSFEELLFSIRRSESLHKDYDYLCEKMKITPKTLIRPETKAYVNYLGQIANDPVKLLAHAYVQYRGLLNGGMILEKRIRNLLLVNKITDSENELDTRGVEFYNFAESSLNTDRVFKDKINESAGIIDKQKFISEVNHSYQLTTSLFNAGSADSNSHNYFSNYNQFWQSNKKIVIPVAVASAALIGLVLNKTL